MDEQQQNPFLIFDDEGYVEPKQEEKDELITKLQSGDFSLSYSSLSAFSVSPRNFIAYKLQEDKPTIAKTIGNVVHCKILEPDQFKERYHIAPLVNAATSEGKNTWAGIFTDLTGITLPTNKQGNYVIPKIDDLIAAVKLHTSKVDENGKVIFPGITILPGSVNQAAEFRARMLLKNRPCRYIINQITEVEHPISFYFCGILFKGRVDGFCKQLIADIKNMPDATIYAATSAIKRRKMGWQAFCYNTAIEGERDAYILAVDGNGETSVHKFSEKNLEQAEIEMSEYCNQFKQLIEESFFDRSVWDQSQDFWLRSEHNQLGINYL